MLSVKFGGSVFPVLDFCSVTSMGPWLKFWSSECQKKSSSLLENRIAATLTRVK
jgi:hypothetical protein